MKNIHIKTSTVISRLQTNYDKYKLTVEAIFDVWKEANEKYLGDYREWMVKVRGKVEGEHKKPHPPVKPTDRTEEYEAWIDYFESDSNEIQEFNYSEFGKFCRDNWAWKVNHIQDMNWYLDSANISAGSISTDKIHALNTSYTSYMSNDLE